MTTSASNTKKTNFLPAMRMLSRNVGGATYAILMAYVNDNGEIHAGPNIDAGGWAETRLLRTVALGMQHWKVENLYDGDVTQYAG